MTAQPPATQIILPAQPRSTLHVVVGGVFLIAVAGLFYLAVRTLDDLDPLPPTALAATTPSAVSAPDDTAARDVIAIQLARDNGEDAALDAIATFRAEDATAQATHDAELVEIAEGAARAAVIPTSAAGSASPYRPCREAATDETCILETATPAPTATPPRCGQGVAIVDGVKVCRREPTATTPVPTSGAMPAISE